MANDIYNNLDSQLLGGRNEDDVATELSRRKRSDASAKSENTDVANEGGGEERDENENLSPQEIEHEDDGFDDSQEEQEFDQANENPQSNFKGIIFFVCLIMALFKDALDIAGILLEGASATTLIPIVEFFLWFVALMHGVIMAIIFFAFIPSGQTKRKFILRYIVGAFIDAIPLLRFFPTYSVIVLWTWIAEKRKVKKLYKIFKKHAKQIKQQVKYVQ